MATKACLTLRCESRHLLLHLFRQFWFDHVVRRDSRSLDRAPRWRVIPCRRKPQAAIRAERDHRLHRAFTEGSSPDNLGTLMILESPGYDFGSRCGPAIDEHDNRFPVSNVSGLCIGAAAFACITALREHDGAFIQESIRDCDRLIEKAAWIVPKVDNVTLKPRAYALLHVVDGLLHILVGVFALERLDLDPTYVILGAIFDWIDAHHVTDNFGLDRRGNAFAKDRERNR